jgi:superfamily II DNA helicase RecQ
MISSSQEFDLSNCMLLPEQKETDEEFVYIQDEVCFNNRCFPNWIQFGLLIVLVSIVHFGTVYYTQSNCKCSKQEHFFGIPKNHATNSLRWTHQQLIAAGKWSEKSLHGFVSPLKEHGNQIVTTVKELKRDFKVKVFNELLKRHKQVASERHERVLRWKRCKQSTWECIIKLTTPVNLSDWIWNRL